MTHEDILRRRMSLLRLYDNILSNQHDYEQGDILMAAEGLRSLLNDFEMALWDKEEEDE